MYYFGSICVKQISNDLPICDHCLQAKSSLSKSQSWQVQLSAACSVGLEITLVSHCLIYWQQELLPLMYKTSSLILWVYVVKFFRKIFLKTTENQNPVEQIFITLL